MTADEALETIPKKIKIGPHAYTVAIVEHVTGDDEAEAQIDTSALLIEIIRKCPSASMAAGRLFHECLHGIWHDRAIGKRPDEERAVLQFEGGVIQLFQDNPKFHRWFKKCIKA